jgi:hypothetical protein
MTAPPTVSRRTALRIHALLATGNTLDFVAERGVYEGWTRADAQTVADACGWELDPSGRVPRRYRDVPLPDDLAPPSPAPPAQAQPNPADVSVDPFVPRVRSGGPYVAALHARDLFVDHAYQRPLDEPRVRRMAAAFDQHLLGILDVSDRGPDSAVDGRRYAVVDGQQRREAAVRASRFGEDVPLACNVHEGLTVADEARLMHELDRRKKKLTGFEQWRARRAAGDRAVLAVEAVCSRHGLRIGSDAVDGVMRSYGTAEKLLKQGGEDLLDQALAVLRGAYDVAAAAFQAPLLMAVGQLLDVTAGIDPERLTAALAANRPEQLRATATALREVEDGPLHSLMAAAIATAYNRTAGRGPRISWSR